MRIKKILSTSLISITIGLAMSCSTKQKVDLIITNATIYSIDSTFSVYQSMVVDKEKIICLGSNEEINLKFEGNEVLNLEGKFVYPGFIDAHCHFLSYGLNLQNAWLSGVASWKDAVKRLVDHQAKHPTQWVLGRGWNQNEWEVKEFPTKELLDKEFPNKPVLLTRVDGHAALANSVALEIAGVKPDTIVTGGELVKINEKLTGLLIDNAIDLVRKTIPAYSQTDKELALEQAQSDCFAVGLTSIGEAGLELADVLLIDSLQKNGKLRMKVNAMLSPTNENFQHFLDKGVFLSPDLTVRTVKLYADGALGSRGALLLEPYSDACQTKGLQVETIERLREICKKAYESGYQVATHCIGDAAVRLMLDVYEEFLTPGNDLRWRIEHAQTVHPSDLNRFGQSSIIPSIQTTHATSDMVWAAKRLGDRIKTAYIYNDLLHQNGWLPNGSDFPIEDINPLYGFYAGVARKDHAGNPETGFQMENSLSREQALKAMTIWAAKAAFEENSKGSLEQGKSADFVVLGQDLMKIPENKLLNLQVEITFINGNVVYLNHRD